MSSRWFLVVGGIGSLVGDDGGESTSTGTSASVGDDSPEAELESEQPSPEPTQETTEEAPEEPTAAPTQEPTEEPTESTEEPTEEPTELEPTKEPREPKLWPVTRVIDGDTVEVGYMGRLESIRVIGIDTPETVHPTEPVECWGPQASTVAGRWLEGRQVRLVFDPSQGRRDVYDRMLAYITIPGRGDFGLAMIRAGNAAEYTYGSAYANQAAYQAAEAQARAADRGLWRKCGGVDVPLVKPEPEPPPPSKPPAGGGGGGTDPQFSYCYEANDAGYGPYYEGKDPEYDWYDDADGDGIVCEP